MSFFPNAQNSSFYNCSFSDSSRNSSALQVLLNATAPGAAYDSEERYPPPRCTPRTRVEVRKNIQEWANQGTARILWFHGPAGAGKSAVAQSMCEAWAEKGQLLASFFFSRTSATRSTISRFVLTIACQAIHFLTNEPSLLLEEVQRNPNVLSMEASKQLEKLLIGPLESLISSQHNRPFPEKRLIIVVDGLDECGSNDDQRRALKLIQTLLTRPGLAILQIRVLVVSRPEEHIHHAFDKLGTVLGTAQSLYGDIEDVATYLEESFNEIQHSEKHWNAMQYVPTPWPGKDVIGVLSRRSGGYFIYAATVVRHVDEEGHLCLDRLNEVLFPETRSLGSNPFMELDKLYSQVLSKARNKPLLKRLLQCMVIGRAHLAGGVDEFATGATMVEIVNALLDLRPGELETCLKGLHSIILITRTSNLPVSHELGDLDFYHASMIDYLLDESRSGDDYVGYENAALAVCRSSLNMFLTSPTLRPIPSSATTLGWSIARISWTDLIGLIPSTSLMNYMMSFAQNQPLAPEPVFDYSPLNGDESWFLQVDRMTRLVLLLEDMTKERREHALLTQIQDLEWALVRSFMKFLDVQHETVAKEISELEPTLRNFCRNDGALSASQEVLKTIMESPRLERDALLMLWVYHRYLPYLYHLSTQTDHSRVKILREDGSVVSMSHTRRLAVMIRQVLTEIELRCIHLLDHPLRTEFGEALSAWKADPGKVFVSTSTPSGTLKSQILSRVYQADFVSRGKNRAYWSRVLLRDSGTISCNEMLSAELPRLATIESASIEIDGIPDKPYLSTQRHFCSCTLAPWQTIRDSSFAKCTWIDRYFWEEAQRHQQWLRDLHLRWIENLSQSWAEYYQQAHCAWREMHRLLRENLAQNDRDGLEVYMEGEEARRRQWKDVMGWQREVHKERSPDWKAEEGRIVHMVKSRQLEIERDVESQPRFAQAAARFGGEWPAVQWIHWCRKKQTTELLAYTAKNISEDTPLVSKADWEAFLAKAVEKEAKRRALWAEVTGIRILGPDQERRFISASL